MPDSATTIGVWAIFGILLVDTFLLTGILYAVTRR